MTESWWRGGGRLRPGLRALLFPPLILGSAMLLFAGWVALRWLSAGESLSDVIGRMNTLSANLIITLAALAATWLSDRFLDGEPRPNLALPLSSPALKRAALGVLAGVAMQGTLYTAGLLSGSYTAQSGTSPGAAFLRYVLAMVFVAAGEELMYRGYMLRRLTDSLGRWPAAWLTALLFTAPHLNNPGAWGMVLVGLIAKGLLYAWVVQHSGTLWPAVGLHWAWNVMEGAVLGLPNSGVSEPFALIRTAVEGPAWWTGGAFGPEAGLLTLLSLPVGFLILRFHRSSRTTGVSG